MSTSIKAIRPEATVAEAINFLTQNHTGGAPVVNDKGELVGMISELSLIDVVFDPAVKDAPITDYMAKDVVSVSPTDALTRAAQLFTLYAFRRLPVVENGKLVGVFTRRDLMNHALHTNGLLTDPLFEIFPALATVGCAT
jgi:CBS domain-containing protein